MTTAVAKALLADIRASLRDQNVCHDRSETDWILLVEQLCDIADEFVWYREEAES